MCSTLKKTKHKKKLPPLETNSGSKLFCLHQSLLLESDSELIIFPYLKKSFTASLGTICSSKT